MKQERVIELYSKAQDEAKGGQLIEYFARLVEQATLERAAGVSNNARLNFIKHARNCMPENKDNWESASEAAGAIRESILALKETHE